MQAEAKTEKIMDSKQIWNISQEEIRLTDHCVGLALDAGASAVRVTMNKSLMDLVTILNGETDKVSHNGDRSLTLHIFADGKFGSFSTNKLDGNDLGQFIRKAVGTVTMLAPDPLRKLPSPERTAKDAIGGKELGLYDSVYEEITADKRMEAALAASYWEKALASVKNCKLISEELEYSDSIYDNYISDSQGLKCRHTETSFEIGCEYTIEDEQGCKYSGYWWDSTPRLEELQAEDCCRKALARAIAQLHPLRHEGGKKTIVVENEVASKLLTPLLNALGGFALQQSNSFLRNSLGKRLLPQGLNIVDEPRKHGVMGSKLFDSEGVATKDSDIIRDGVVMQYFANTYIAGKMGIEPTVEDATRPVVLPYLSEKLRERATEYKGVLDDILRLCGEGILVTGLNGGNSNSATGDFSYGIEGFAVKDGKIAEAIDGMVITGNFLTLWNHLLAAGSDPRPCMSKQVPTLAFSDVDVSA